MVGINQDTLYVPETKPDLHVRPCVFVRFPEANFVELSKQILKRAILIKEIIDVFSTYVQPET